MANELKITITADTANAHAALQRINDVIGTSAERARVYSDALDRASQSGLQNAEAIKAAAVVLEQYIAAQEAATASAETFSAATATATAAEASLVSGTVAANGAMKVLEGSMMGASRAAGSFLASTLGLGNALALAFPVIGAAALGMVVADVGKKLYDAFDLGGEQARKTAQDIQDVDVALRSMNDSLDVEIDRLQIADEKLEHKPVNGMKLAIDEAAEAADRLDQKLDSVYKKIEGTLKGLATPTAKQVLTLGMGGSGTDYEQTLLAQHSKWMSLAQTEQEQMKESAFYAGSLQDRLKELQRWQTQGGGPGIEIDFSNEIKATQKLIEWQEQEQKAIQHTMDLEKEQKKHGEDVGKPKPESQMHAYEDQLNQIKQFAGPSYVTADDEALFWQNKLAAATKGTAEYSEILAKSTQAQAQAERQRVQEAEQVHEALMFTFEQQTRAQEQELRKQEENDRRAAESFKRTQEEKMRGLEQATEAAQRQAELTYRGSTATIQFQQKSGSIDHAGATSAKIAAVQAEAAQELQAYYVLYQAEAQAAIDGDQKKINDRMQTAAKIQEIIERERQQELAIVQQNTLQQQALFDRMFNSIDNSFNNSVNAWLQGGQRMSAVWTKMADQMAISTIDALLKIAAQEAIGAALHKTIGDQQRLEDAKGAFTATYKAISGIPYVGPFLAPEMAAAAFAATAAFETGADLVPRTGMAFLHEGERVLDRDSNRQITRALTSGPDDRGGSGGIHFHDNSSWNGVDGASVEGMFRNHGTSMRREIMRQLRLSNRI